MAEEFAEFIKKLNKEPIEEQVAKLKNVVFKLVNITENFIKYYDMEHSIINNKIIKLETAQIKAKLPKIKVLATPPPPPPPQARPVGNNGVRTAIMSELKELFKNKG